jgi:glycosyltransferase involved in cell wall biosynthesis
MKPFKNFGEAKMIFLSRFMRKKNFKWLLENLTEIKGNLVIDIYGPLEDAGYWRECEQIIKNLPANIKVEAKGSIPHEKVLETIVKYHFFILPTLGENFGHVFLEALACGCPLIISDQTPWLKLNEKGIGWDITLENPQKWVEIINLCMNLSDVSYRKISAKSRQYVLDWLADSKIEENTLTILEKGLSNEQI